MCGACGHVHAGLTLKDRVWTCPACGATHDRAANAARYLLAEGARLFALREPGAAPAALGPPGAATSTATIVAAWSATMQRSITLAEYIVSRAPNMAEKLHLAQGDPGPLVPRVGELSEEALCEVVCSRLRQGTDGRQLAVLGQGTFSSDDLAQHVRRGTPLGQRLLAAARRSSDLIEQLADAGKLGYAEEGREDHIEEPEMPS